MKTKKKKKRKKEKKICQFPYFTPIRLTRNGLHKGSVALFVHNSVNCKEQPDVSKSDYIIETLPTDIIKKKNKKNLLFLACTGHNTVMENYLKVNIKV